MPCAPGPARSGLELTRQSSGCAGLDHDGRRHQHLRPLLVRAHSGAGPCSSSMTAPPVVDPVVRHLGRALLPRVDEFAQQAFRVGGREQYGNLEHTAVVRARSMAPIGRPAGWLSTLVALLWMSRTTLAAKSVSQARCPIHGWAVHWRATSSAIRARCAVRKI